MAEYNSFEIKEGGLLERVESSCRHLTTGGSFKDDSPVILADVQQYIDDAYYWLLGELARNGYATAQTDTKVKGVLQIIQALDAAVQIEFSVPVTSSGEPNERYKGLIARRDRLVKTFLAGRALLELGATMNVQRGNYLDATGRSVQNKRDVYTGSDVVQPRFPRGFGHRKDVGHRTGTEQSHLADPEQV